MKTIDQFMCQMIQKSAGNILAIVPTSCMEQELKSNEMIMVCDVLNRQQNQSKGKMFSKKMKPFNFKKVRKTFQKKKKDIVIGNIEELERYFKTFVADSIYITKGSIYLFTYNKDYDFDLLHRQYSRFVSQSKSETCLDGIVFIVEVNNAKNHFWKEKIYYVTDIVINVVDAIGDALIH